MQFEILDFSDRPIKSLLPELIKSLPSLPPNPDKKRVLILRGLEKSIGAVAEYPPFLQDLNFIRDALARRVSYPIIFVLPKYAIKRLARVARDFWSWASTVFEFRSAQQQIATVRAETLNPSRLFSSDLKPVKQSRIDQLNSLLEEYAPTDKEDDWTNADIRLDILLELGAAYFSLAEVKRAEQCFRRAIQLARESQSRQSEANALLGLGKTLRLTETNTKALTVFEYALTIYREVGDRLGEANTLQAVGDVQQFLNQSREALANYDQALTIYREVGDRLGEANTLQELGSLLGGDSEALEMYESAQSIYVQIGDRYSQARNLV